MRYEEREATVHDGVKREPVWQFLGYRKALFFWSPSLPANAPADPVS